MMLLDTNYVMRVLVSDSFMEASLHAILLI
jgi:hypothetical protein